MLCHIEAEIHTGCNRKKKTLYTYATLDFRSLLNMLGTKYGKPDSIAVSNCNNHVNRSRDDRDMANMAMSPIFFILGKNRLSDPTLICFLVPVVGIKTMCSLLPYVHDYVMSVLFCSLCNKRVGK